MGFMKHFQTNGQIGLAVVEHLGDAFKAFRTHKNSVFGRIPLAYWGQRDLSNIYFRCGD
jgi:hypothetical protein